MPWEDHPNCDAPANDQQRLWRYMDLWKFTSIVQTQGLYFARLTDLDDPWEGFLTSATVGMLQAALVSPNATATTRENVPRIIRMYEDARQRLFASCWHMAERESAAMWKIYAAEGGGVCISTTVTRIREALQAEVRPVIGGVVKYVDYEIARIDWRNMVVPALHKRLPFEYEQEFRALYLNPGPAMAGLLMTVDLGRLIDRVILAPGLPGWSESVVRNLMDYAGLPDLVQRSEMDVASVPSRRFVDKVF